MRSSAANIGCSAGGAGASLGGALGDGRDGLALLRCNRDEAGHAGLRPAEALRWRRHRRGMGAVVDRRAAFVRLGEAFLIVLSAAGEAPPCGPRCEQLGHVGGFVGDQAESVRIVGAEPALPKVHVAPECHRVGPVCPCDRVCGPVVVYAHRSGVAPDHAAHLCLYVARQVAARGRLAIIVKCLAARGRLPIIVKCLGGGHDSIMKIDWRAARFDSLEATRGRPGQRCKMIQQLLHRT